MTENYTLAAYVADLRAIVAETDDEAKIISRVRPLAQKLVANSGTWFKPEYTQYDPERGTVLNVLNEEDDHSLMAFTGCLRPGYVSKVHDHGTWAVVVGIQGEECNTMYSREDDGSVPGHGEIRKRGEKVFHNGDVLAMPSGTYHTVSNKSDAVSVALHTYGMSINHTGRCQIDPETGKVEEFKIPLKRV